MMRQQDGQQLAVCAADRSPVWFVKLQGKNSGTTGMFTRSVLEGMEEYR
ncbi:hypothetical protein [Niabella terrae]